MGSVQAPRLRAVVFSALLLPDQVSFVRDGPMVEGDAAGFAGDGPEVHDVAAVRDGHRGILRAPPGGERWIGTVRWWGM